MTILIILCILILAVLAISYICFRMAFYAPPRKPMPPDFIDIPDGEAYAVFRDQMTQWVLDMRALPREDVSITSFDGLTLTGKFFEFAPGAPVELMFHGYRGSAERDLSGGVDRAFRLGRSVLLVDQRCSGNSQGNVISFGINEHKDCLRWVDFMVEHFGPEVRIILTGISMGAATVLMTADQPLPPQVIGILADCGYNSPKDIIKTVVKTMGLPPAIGYFFVKLGARIFGHFDLEETSPEKALKNCTLPVIFFHGEADDYVPCEMSKINYDACSSRKMLVTVPDAGHGLSYIVAPQKYLDALRAFFNEK